jgi:thiamine biosynthesis protein ThiC
MEAIITGHFTSQEHLESVAKQNYFTLHEVVTKKLVSMLHTVLPRLQDYQLVDKGCGFIRVYDVHNDRGTDFTQKCKDVAEFLIEKGVAILLWD